MNMRLRDLIEALKMELRASQSDNPLFSVSKASITTRIVTKRRASAEGGIEVWVKLGATIDSEDEQEHEVTVELQLLDELHLGED